TTPWSGASACGSEAQRRSRPSRADDCSARRRRETSTIAGRTPRAASERPPPRARLDEVPRRGPSEERPAVRERARERAPEVRAEIGCGEVVAFEAERDARRVVALLGVVQRRVHVIGEGHRAACAYARDEAIAKGHALQRGGAGGRTSGGRTPLRCVSSSPTGMCSDGFQVRATASSSFARTVRPKRWYEESSKFGVSPSAPCGHTSTQSPQ